MSEDSGLIRLFWEGDGNHSGSEDEMDRDSDSSIGIRINSSDSDTYSNVVSSVVQKVEHDSEEQDPDYWRNLCVGGFVTKLEGLNDRAKVLEMHLSHGLMREEKKQVTIEKLKGILKKRGVLGNGGDEVTKKSLAGGGGGDLRKTEELNSDYWKNLATHGFAGELRDLKDKLKRLEQELNQVLLRELAKLEEIEKLRSLLLRNIDDTSDSEDEKEDDGDPEENHPLAVFPLEIWQMIFDNLKDAPALAACADTSIVFYEALKPTKIQWQFAKVLPIIFNQLSRSDLLRCREVCSLWRSAVDWVFDNPSSVPKLTPMSCNNPVSGKGFSYFNLDQHFEADDPKPFTRNFIFGGKITFSLPRSRDNFWGQVRPFLESYGSYIATLCLDTYNGNIPNPREDHLCWGLVSNLLAHLPNLKSLQFEGGFSREWDGDGIVTFQHVFDSLPNLPLLEHLDIFATNGYTQLQKLLMAKYLSQLKSFRGYMSCWSLDDMKKLKWTGLEELKVDHFGCLHGLEHLQDFITCVDMRVLRKLTLMEIPSPEGIGLVLTIISRLPALKTLRISFRNEGIGAKEQESVKALPASLYAPPTLKSLEVFTSNKLDFLWLLRFPFIEELHFEHSAYFWRHEPKESVKLQEVVKIQEYLDKGRMYQSNIWKLFPGLKRVTYLKDKPRTAQVYRRREWQELMETPKVTSVSFF